MKRVIFGARPSVGSSSRSSLWLVHWRAAGLSLGGVVPDAVACIVVNCGSARTATHNRIFLSSLMATLEAAKEHTGNSRFSAPPKAAIRAFGRIYAGWALSQDFYRANLHLTALKAPDLETFLRTDWEDRYARRNAADLYAQLRAWDGGDISNNTLYSGDLTKALNPVKAKVLLMPGATELSFRVADNEAELPHLRNAELPGLGQDTAGNYCHPGTQSRRSFSVAARTLREPGPLRRCALSEFA